MALQGKGLWAYRRWELDRALRIAPQMGITHVLYKVGQGPREGEAGFYIDDAVAIADQIRTAGYVPLAWSFATLKDPIFEAQMVVDAFIDGYEGFIFDVETARELRENAQEIGRRLHAANVDPDQLYLCSYPTPITHHPDLPFNEMGSYCLGGLMPMAYGTYQLPPGIVVDTWTYEQNRQWMAQQGLRLPIHPVFGPYFDEQGNDRMSAAEFRTWLDHFAKGRPSFLSLFTTAVLEAEYFPPTRAFELGEPSPPLPAPSMKVKVISPDVGYLNVRSGPETESAIVTQASHGSLLDALEPAEQVQAKVGTEGEWLFIRTPSGKLGYTAGWYLAIPGVPPPPPEPPSPPQGEALTHPVVESPDYGLRVRHGPGTSHDQIWWVPHGTVLASLEPPEITGGKVGKQGEWLHVRTPTRREGYVAAWYLRRPERPDEREPVEDDTLPLGQSAWLFGMHAADLNSDTAEERARLRQLFEGQGRRGWILFTEALGVNPDIPLNGAHRETLWNWAEAGYGVVIRLNHGYHPAGTLPTSDRYLEFAETCARWVDLHLKRDEVAADSYSWIIQIANEQNNVSEHPHEHGVPKENITPELYAAAFNAVYKRIKAVLPNALVAPGAIDPYHSHPMQLAGNKRYRPIDYYQEMLDKLDALDALLLHAYTHGPSVERVTALTTFGDPFMSDHYFDFQTYRHVLERVPAKWRHVPVLITESNHICRGSNAPACDDPHRHGWENANIGWVRAVYDEIQRWNQRPHAQQILGLLLYRWTGDAWRLRDKDQVLADFHQAMTHDYRWRASKAEVEVDFAVAFAAPTPPRAAPSDDLTLIWGLGPRAAQVLAAAGITRFETLAKMTGSWLEKILREAGYPVVSRVVATWPTQARLAHKEAWETLTTFQNWL